MELRELLWSSAELETTQQTGQTKMHSFLLFDLYSSSSSSSLWRCCSAPFTSFRIPNSLHLMQFSSSPCDRDDCTIGQSAVADSRTEQCKEYYTMALNACSKIVIFNWSIANRIKSWYKYINLNWSRRNEKNSGNVMFVVLCWKENEMFSPRQYVYKQQAGHYIEINTRKNEWLRQNENGMNKKNLKFE